MNVEEKLQILQMIESKQITPEEGMKLLEAVEGSERNLNLQNDNYYAQFLRIRVVEKNSTKVNVNIPITLIEVLMNTGMKFVPQDVPELKSIDFMQIVSQVKAGARGKLIEVDDGDTYIEVAVQ